MRGRTVRLVARIAAALLLVAVFVAMVCAALAYRRLGEHRDSFYFTGEDAFYETTDALSNPYCGWYEIYGYRVGEDKYLGTEVGWHLESSLPEDRLVLLEIDLEAYSDGDISEHGLIEIDNLLQMWESADKQIMVRFLYDFAGLAQETEPADISIIKRHIEQCAEILNAHKEHIYLTQGIFVGNIGEMHSSDYMTTEGMRELGRYYADALDDNIFLSVRTPEHYRIICGRSEPIGADEAFGTDIGARMGLFNDGMLASGNDLGTYGDGPMGELTADYEGKGSRAEELAFQNELCRYVPSGGEVVSDNEYNDLMNAVADLREMHVSFLGRYHDDAVKEKWRVSEYDAYIYGDTLYDGMDGFSYIERHLGYRYVVRESGQRERDIWSGNVGVYVGLENVGFSNAYKRFDVSLVLAGENGDVMSMPLDADNRFWDSDAGEIFLEAKLPFEGLSTQEYEVYLAVSDPVTGEEISFANGESGASSYGTGVMAFGAGAPEGMPEEAVRVGRLIPAELSDDELWDELRRHSPTEIFSFLTRQVDGDE